MNIFEALDSNNELSDFDLALLVEVQWLMRHQWIWRLDAEVERRMETISLVEAAKLEQLQTQLAKRLMGY